MRKSHAEYTNILRQAYTNNTESDDFGVFWGAGTPTRGPAPRYTLKIQEYYGKHMQIERTH